MDLRLLLEDVEPGTGDPALLKRPNERGLVDDRPPRGVHEDRRLLHEPQGSLAHIQPAGDIVDGDVARREAARNDRRRLADQGFPVCRLHLPQQFVCIVAEQQAQTTVGRRNGQGENLLGQLDCIVAGGKGDLAAEIALAFEIRLAVRVSKLD